MSPEQEPKYSAFCQCCETHHSRIVNRATGEPIPDDEPVFILRARDRHAARALQAYADLCHDAEHVMIVQRRIRDFLDFDAMHPDRMKEPDSPA